MQRSLRPLWLLSILALVSPIAWGDCLPAQDTLQHVRRLVEAEASAREALVTVRRSAQDWKNLLLRGADPTQKASLQARFETQARSYEAQLTSLRGQLESQPPELERLRLLESERVVLFERYRAALARHGVATLEAAAAADREVQGADVTTFRALEQAIDSLSAQRTARLRDLTLAIERCEPTARK